ncbi:MAG: HEAT repeat domain-containing protein [Cyanobacteria bacterium]|nr:HEAT repeat domain-containing protein [Cyanobacteriota bacterium]
MLFQIPTQIFAPCLPALALLAAGLVSVPLPSYGQTKPNPTPSAPPAATVKAPIKKTKDSIKKTKDWWVPGLLGGSILIAGIGIVLAVKRSPPPITEAPEPILYKPPELQPTSTITASNAESPAKKPWQLNSPTTPVNEPASIELEEPTLELANKPDLETTTIATTVRMPKVSVMDSLVHELRNPDPAKRHKAIWELGRSGDSRAVQPMVDLLLDSDSRQRSLVLSALSEISSRTLKPMSRALAISMQDENPDVRKNAIRDLTHIYDSLTRISELLQNACEDPDQEVQDTAKWAIGQINRIKSPLIQGAGRSVSKPESLN